MGYTDQDRTDAVALYVEHGLAEAHRRTGVPRSTLRGWARSEGHKTSELSARASDKTAAATRARTLTMDQRRVSLAERLMDEAELLTDQMFAPCVERRVVTLSGGLHNEGSWEIVDVERPQPTFADQKLIATTRAIDIDKVQVLTGEATERVEVRDARARATELVDELARRRASKAA